MTNTLRNVVFSTKKADHRYRKIINYALTWARPTLFIFWKDGRTEVKQYTPLPLNNVSERIRHNSVLNHHFMKISTEIDNNFGYENITQLVDNIPLKYSSKS
jgi:hypothetical protein